MRRASSFGARILQVLSALILATVSAFSANVTLAWDPNTETDLAGYRLYYGTASGTYPQSIDVGNVTNATVPNLLDGTTYYFAVTAYNAATIESAWSNEITHTTGAPPNLPPTVAMTAPANGSTYLAPADITINASAADTDGTIARVEFYQGAAKLGEDATSPYSFAWSGATAGIYALTVRAIDNLGSVTSTSEVSVIVSLPNQAPSVTITSPAIGATFTSPASIAIAANAGDADGTVARVEFYSGATKLGEDVSSPFSFNWSGVTAGSYSLTARAIDNHGATATSSPISIAVREPNQAPTVAMLAPLHGTIVTAPVNISLSASASDSDGSVIRVEFYHGTTKLGEDTTSPFAFTWNSPPPGTYALTAIAFDNEGALTTSTATNLIVNAPPTIALSSNNTTFAAPASITLTATASDADGTVSKVEYFSGSSKIGESASAPHSFIWGNVSAGTYALTARATDNRSATTTSSPLTVSVTAPNQPPTIAISTTSGTSTASLLALIAPATITISASATDPDGTIARVDFYQGTTKIAQDTSSPYSYNWTNVPAGTYSLTAVAIDNAGASATSTPISVTVQAGPNIVLTTNGTTFNPGSTINLTASTSQLSGRVKRVDFYRNSSVLYRDTKSPYVYSWKSVPAGTYSLTAVATMTTGVIYTSSPVVVTVGISQLSALRDAASIYESSMPTLTTNLDPDGTFNLGITGQYGQTYDVWVSTDLKDWSLMTTVTNLNGSVSVTDSDAPAHKRRFYRVSVQQ